MFKNPFSFKGRIRRKEYITSFMIVRILGIIFCLLNIDDAKGVIRLVYVIVIVAIIWIQLAQATKRCHDRNNSRWFQLIPFYDFWLLFADGYKQKNQYGPSPKYHEYD